MITTLVCFVHNKSEIKLVLVEKGKKRRDLNKQLFYPRNVHVRRVASKSNFETLITDNSLSCRVIRVTSNWKRGQKERIAKLEHWSLSSSWMNLTNNICARE